MSEDRPKISTAPEAHETPVVTGQHSSKRQWRPYLVDVVTQPSFVEYFDLATRSDSTSLISCMNSLFFAGAAIFILTVPIFADRWGRRAAVAVSAAIIVISGAVMAGSVNVGQFIVFRFVSGAG
ncbi:MFS domain-containing protein [Fusarium keratoplasticum]|nr:MFS domain-containing protein [Fusarium keratoplasticum]